MLARKKLFSLLLLSLFGLSGCSGGKSKKSLIDNKDNKVKKEKIVVENKTQEVFVNSLVLSENSFSLEVIYLIDQENSVYKEWVKVLQDGELKITKFEFNFSKDLYLRILTDLKSVQEELFKDGLGDYVSIVSQKDMILLESRFDNQISDSEFNQVKDQFLSDNLNYTVVTNMLNSRCDEEWHRNNEHLRLNYINSFQHCAASKYQNLAISDLKKFLVNRNRYLFQPDLFGFWKVVPRIMTFLEFQNNGDGPVKLITSVFPISSPAFQYLETRNRGLGNTCEGEFVEKKSPDYTRYKNYFLGASKEIQIQDFQYYALTCYETYRENLSQIEEQVSLIYPNTSRFFQKELVSNIKTGFYNFEKIDVVMSKLLDKKIEKYNFLISTDKLNDPRVVYQNWMVAAFKNKNPNLMSWFHTWSNSDSNLEALTNYVLEQREQLWITDGLREGEVDTFYDEDKRALESLDEYILKVDL